MFEVRGRRGRCPNCGEQWEEHEPLPSLPRVFVPENRLQDPDFPQVGPIEPPPAPMYEFVAAFGVMGGFLTMIAGVVLLIPLLLLVGMTVLGLAAIVYGVTKMRRILRRGLDGARDRENPWRYRGPFGGPF
jgi:hypothetical protein